MFVLYRSPPFKNNKWTPDIAIPCMCDRQLKLCPKLTCDQCHEKEYHMPCYIMPQHKFSDADGYPDRKVHNNGIRKIRSIYKMYELET